MGFYFGKDFYFWLYFALAWLLFTIPLIAGIVIFKNHRQDVLSLAGGVFAVKPIIATPLFILILNNLPDSAPESAHYLSLLPAVLLTLAIIFFFRRLFGSNPAAFSLLIFFDVLRWLNTLILESPWFIEDINTFTIIGAVLPNLYAIGAILLANLRARRARALPLETSA